MASITGDTSAGGSQSDPMMLDERAKRTRELLASFYSPDPAAAAAAAASPLISTARAAASLDSINSSSFDPDIYMSLLIQKSNLEGLLSKHVAMATEIKTLDTDLQMLVYENYNKFISATDTIKRMKNNIVGMETNTEQLLEKIISVQSKSDKVNTSLFEKREHIEKLHRTRNLLRKVQFIYDLPARLEKCIKTECYADAVRFFIGAKPIFEAYGESSFQDCKKASKEAMDVVVTNLQAKVYLDSESNESRAEAVVLLKQLNFPVDILKAKLLEKLDDFMLGFNFDSGEVETSESDGSNLYLTGDVSDATPKALHALSSNKASICEFSMAVRAYLIIFPDSEKQLIELAQRLFAKCYGTVQQHIKKKVSSADLLVMLRLIWADVAVVDGVLPEAALPAFSIQTTSGTIRQYISLEFSNLLQGILESLTRTHPRSKEVSEESSLQILLETGKKAVVHGSMDILLEFKKLLHENHDLLSKLKDSIIDWVQEGFHDLFQKLEYNFHLLCGRRKFNHRGVEMEDSLQMDKVQTGLVLVLAQLSVFIEQNAIPTITEEVAASFSGGGVRGYDYGPPFVPGVICRLFRSAAEKFLNLYIKMQTQKLSTILKKRFITPNWLKHKEPREVHRFTDLILQELEYVRFEVGQILSHGLIRRHRHSDSTGSTNSSRSNPMHEDKLNRSNTQRARSQLLESHLAKLFEQKMEILTKVEFTQESVLTTIIKLCLKSLQEFVRLQTFNRSGYQQVQLDIEFLKNPLKMFIVDDATIDFLLKEVTNAAHERCLDPIPLEIPILDKLIQAKLAQSKGQSPSSQ